MSFWNLLLQRCHLSPQIEFELMTLGELLKAANLAKQADPLDFKCETLQINLEKHPIWIVLRRVGCAVTNQCLSWRKTEELQAGRGLVVKETGSYC